MSEAPQAGGLFPAADGERSTGLLPAQLLRAAALGGHEVMAAAPIGDDQIQPASIDLRLGEVAYRVRASFLPGARASVADKLQELEGDINGAVLATRDGVTTAQSRFK